MENFVQEQNTFLLIVFTQVAVGLRVHGGETELNEVGGNFVVEWNFTYYFVQEVVDSAQSALLNLLDRLQTCNELHLVLGESPGPFHQVGDDGEDVFFVLSFNALLD